ncbi:MAG: oligopeptide/dipeptide ABC transporter ATP-binding protein, partial [Acidimicrobiia bacterium]
RRRPPGRHTPGRAPQNKREAGQQAGPDGPLGPNKPNFSTLLAAIGGRPPDLINPPRGCNFAPRCPYAQARCHEEEPPLASSGTPGHTFACWYPVGTEENREALERNLAAGLAQAQVAIRGAGAGLVADAG